MRRVDTGWSQHEYWPGTSLGLWVDCLVARALLNTGKLRKESLMRRAALFLLTMLAFSTIAWAVGEMAVDFSLQDLEGRAQRLSEQKGKVVLLSFWMTWCAPCKVEIPHLVRLYNQYKDQGFVVWGITGDAPSDLPKVRSLVRAYSMTYPVLLDQDSRVNNLYNPRSDYPMSVLVNKEGRVVWSHIGFQPGDEVEIEKQIKAALGI